MANRATTEHSVSSHPPFWQLVQEKRGEMAVCSPLPLQDSLWKVAILTFTWTKFATHLTQLGYSLLVYLLWMFWDTNHWQAVATQLDDMVAQEFLRTGFQSPDLLPSLSSPSQQLLMLKKQLLQVRPISSLPWRFILGLVLFPVLAVAGQSHKALPRDSLAYCGRKQMLGELLSHPINVWDKRFWIAKYIMVISWVRRNSNVKQQQQQQSDGRNPSGTNFLISMGANDGSLIGLSWPDIKSCDVWCLPLCCLSATFFSS